MCTCISINSYFGRNMDITHSFNERITLIAGGYDKNLDYTPLAKPILDNCKTLILLGQTADKIEEVVNKENAFFKIFQKKC